MKEIYTTQIMPFGYSGYQSYKVEIDLTDNHRQMQRHIFIKPDGQQNTEDWIPSMGFTKEELLKGGFKRL